MAITSKEIALTIIGVILASIIALLFKLINYNRELSQIENLVMISLFAVAIVVVIYLKINEINKELDNQRLEQQKLNEKLIIYERLSKIEKRLFKNE